MKLWFAALACSASLFAAPALAADGAADAAKFGALEAIRSLALSPNGNLVALVGPYGDSGQALTVIDLTGPQDAKPILAVTEPGRKLHSCEWLTDSRLVCWASVISIMEGHPVPFTRIFAIDRNGGNVQNLVREDFFNAGGTGIGGDLIDRNLPEGHVLIARWNAERVSDNGGSNIKGKGEGMVVDDLDTVTMKRRTIENPRFSGRTFITDGHGSVRIAVDDTITGTERLGSTRRYFYRKPGSREYERLSQSDFTGPIAQGFAAEAVDGERNVAYGFDAKDGHQALYSVSLDGSLTKTLLLSRPDFDIDSLVRIGRSDRVVGASYAADQRTVEYFDPEIAKLARGLAKALPGNPMISFIDASDGEAKLLLATSNDTDPGMYYLYDKATHQLGSVLPVRPQLAGVKLAPMQSVHFAAADGTQIPAYLTLPPGSSGKGLPAIVMPHGGPEARDEWGFDWLVQFFAARGFAVLQPNFRGSTGYGEAFFAKNGFQSWRTAIGDVNDAGRWLAAQGIAAPGKLAIVGWSYGGYAALQSAVLDPDLYKAIVAIAPVTDLETLREQWRDFSIYAIKSREIGTGPHVIEGSPARNAARIKAPVLMFHGDKDLNVDIGESRLMAKKLAEAGRPATLVEFPGLTHGLESAKARTTLLSQSDAFLRKALGIE